MNISVKKTVTKNWLNTNTPKHEQWLEMCFGSPEKNTFQNSSGNMEYVHETRHQLNKNWMK